MRYFLTFFFAMALCFGVSAQSGISYHSDEVENGYNFILYTPDSVKSAKPLIITLHSRSASGKNLQSVDYFGTIDAIESGIKINAYVVAPQATGADWDSEKVMNVVNYVVGNNNIDENRIYAVGMSMGGNGVADLAAAYHDKIAAAIVLAGSLTNGRAEDLSKLPLWVIRGTDDREEAILRTDNMVEAIRKHDSSRIVYSKVKGLNHREHERILYMPEFYEWLMSHSLQNINRSVNTTPDLTAKMLKNAYKGLNLRDGSAAKRKSRPHHGPRGPRRW